MQSVNFISYQLHPSLDPVEWEKKKNSSQACPCKQSQVDASYGRSANMQNINDCMKLSVLFFQLEYLFLISECQQISSALEFISTKKTKENK